MKFKYIGAVTLTSIVLCIALQSVQETNAEGSGDNDKFDGSSSSGRGTKYTSKSSTKSFTKKAVTFAAGAYTAKKAAKMAKKVDSLNRRII